MAPDLHRKLDKIADRLSVLQRGQTELERGLAELRNLLARQTDVPGHAAASGRATQEPHDGPLPYEKFRLKGKEHGGFSVLEWRLLESLWGQVGVSVQDVLDHVYGHDSDQSDTALDSLKKRLNRKLRTMPCPAKVEAG